jgi:hypothetical protein
MSNHWLPTFPALVEKARHQIRALAKRCQPLLNVCAQVASQLGIFGAATSPGPAPQRRTDGTAASIRRLKKAHSRHRALIFTGEASFRQGSMLHATWCRVSHGSMQDRTVDDLLLPFCTSSRDRDRACLSELFGLRRQQRAAGRSNRKIALPSFTTAEFVPQTPPPPSNSKPTSAATSMRPFPASLPSPWSR